MADNDQTINEDAPTNAVGTGAQVSGMTADTVGVDPKKKKKVLTFKQMLSRKNVDK